MEVKLCEKSDACKTGEGVGRGVGVKRRSVSDRCLSERSQLGVTEECERMPNYYYCTYTLY